MSISTTSRTLREEVHAVVLSELAKLRLPADEIIGALAAGGDPRIPSRKSIVIIARVQQHFGLGGQRVVTAADLKPSQVSSVKNLIDLLTRRLGPALKR